MSPGTGIMHCTEKLSAKDFVADICKMVKKSGNSGAFVVILTNKDLYQKVVLLVGGRLCQRETIMD